jgi:hypothetical protein
MDLLKGLISNVEIAKKLDEQSNEGKLLNFYKFDLSSKLHFGKHQICQDAATECDARFKKLAHDFGMTLQAETQVARELTAHLLRKKLTTCGDDFLEFGKKEWMLQCKKTSRVNILDQHFTVRGQRIEAPESATPDADDEDETAVEFTTKVQSNSEQAQFEMFKISAYLFSAAISDSRREVNKDIRRRRAQITEAKEKAAQLKAKQTMVDVTADAIKPTDALMTLGRRFDIINGRIDALQSNQASIEAQAPVTKAAQRTMDIENGDGEAHDMSQRVYELEKRLSALEPSIQAAKSHSSSKNETTADSAEIQQSAHASKRRRKRRADSATQEATSMTAPATPRMTMPASQHQRPTVQYNGNGQGQTTTRHHPQQSSNHAGRGRGQKNDAARRPQDERQRPSSAGGQSGQARPQRGPGSGRGPGPGQARA